MVDKSELLKLLPKLIREDDEVKGAIITALSGVVATKDDIARMIEVSNRRFEEINARFEEINARFEGINARFEGINARFEEARQEREDIKESMIILRETAGELLKKTADLEEQLNEKTATLKDDIKQGNEEILGYLRSQFEEE